MNSITWKLSMCVKNIIKFKDKLQIEKIFGMHKPEKRLISRRYKGNSYYKKKMINKQHLTLLVIRNLIEIMWYHVHPQTGRNFKKPDNSKGWGGLQKWEFNMAA